MRTVADMTTTPTSAGSSAGSPRRPGAPRLSDRLEREWQLIAHRQHVVDRARSWELGGEAFDDLDELLRLAGFFVPSTVATDATLLRLVELAGTDDLAGRIVLQRILPGLLAICRRRRIYGDLDAFEEIVGAAWIAIRTFRTDRRRTHVASNLVRDAAHRAFIGPTRRHWSAEVATDPIGFDDLLATDVESPCDELARVLVEAQQDGVPAADVTLVRQLVRSGSRVVADEVKVTMRTVRNRRDRITASIREAGRAAECAA